MARALRQSCGAALLITRGAEGMTLFEPGAPALHIEVEARHVYDVTGAGDTVVAAIALGLAAGLALPLACRLGNLAAGIAVGEAGAAAVSRDQLQAALLASPATLTGTHHRHEAAFVAG